MIGKVDGQHVTVGISRYVKFYYTVYDARIGN